MLLQYLINVKPLCVAYSPRPDEVMIVRDVQPLTDEQRALLEKTMKEDTAFRARSRAQSRLLRAAGTPSQTMAKTSQVHRVTVSAWRQTWARYGAQSLPAHPRRGSPPPRTPDAQERAKHSSKEAPRSLKQVVERCANTTEQRRSIASLQRLATKARLRGKRVRKSFTRLREPEACAPGQRALDAWQHHDDQGTIALYDGDASGWALAPSLPSAWQEPHRVIALPARQEGRRKVLGVMQRPNEVQASLFEASIHTGVLLACCEALCHTRTTKTVVVSDQASLHTSDACAARLPSWKTHGLLSKFLSPYSPALHRIEILGRRITYTWLPFSAYACLNAVSEALETILRHVGSEYQITFA